MNTLIAVVVAAAGLLSDATGPLQLQIHAVANARLQPLGLSIDATHARLSIPASAGKFPDTSASTITPLWQDGQVPVLPLQFALRWPGDSRSVTATLATPLLRSVWVAGKRLDKGVPASCSDLVRAWRPLTSVAALDTTSGCRLEKEDVVRRDLLKDELVRPDDIGSAPDVVSGTTVRVRVTAGQVELSMTGLALNDARMGGDVAVRLAHPARRLKAHVIGPGQVQLEE